MTGLKNSRRILFAMIMVAPALVLAPRVAFADGGGEVQPPKAKPHGYSLPDMASEIALLPPAGWGRWGRVFDIGSNATVTIRSITRTRRFRSSTRIPPRSWSPPSVVGSW